MDYTQFANHTVRITSTETPFYKGRGRGFQSDAEINENVF